MQRKDPELKVRSLTKSDLISLGTGQDERLLDQWVCLLHWHAFQGRACEWWDGAASLRLVCMARNATKALGMISAWA